jgi:hypothetical protein
LTIVAGVDQGQGAWHSWIKTNTMSGDEICDRMGKEDNFDPKSAYIISQVAHISCKKDHHTILSSTVSDDLSAAYEKLQSSALVFVRVSTDEKKKKVKSYFLSKYDFGIQVEKDPSNSNNCVLTYTLQRKSFHWILSKVL